MYNRRLLLSPHNLGNICVSTQEVRAVGERVETKRQTDSKNWSLQLNIQQTSPVCVRINIFRTCLKQVSRRLQKQCLTALCHDYIQCAPRSVFVSLFLRPTSDTKIPQIHGVYHLHRSSCAGMLNPGPCARWTNVLSTGLYCQLLSFL